MYTKLGIVTFNDILVVMKYRVVHLCPEMVFIVRGGKRSVLQKPLKFSFATPFNTSHAHLNQQVGTPRMSTPSTRTSRRKREMTEPDLSTLVDLEALKNDATMAQHAASQSQDLSGFRVLDEPQSPVIAATPSPTTDATHPTPTLSSLVYRTHWRKATDGKLANNTATMPSTPAPETKEADPATDHPTTDHRPTPFSPATSTALHQLKHTHAPTTHPHHKKSMSQSMFDLLSASTDDVEESLENAASTLQRVYRGWQGRKNYDAQRLEEYILAKNPLTTLFCFLFFLFVIIITCVFETENVQYYMAHQLSDWIVEEEFTPEQSQIKKNFNDIESEEEMWQYLQGPFVNNLFTEEGPPHVLFPGTVLAGAVRLRQMRVQPKCDEKQQHVPKIFAFESGPTTGCWPSWAEGTESKASYGIYDQTNRALRHNSSTVSSSSSSSSHVLQSETKEETDQDSNERMNRLRQCFTYTDGQSSAPITDQTTVTITGWEEQYPSAGGFVCDMSGNYTHAQVVDLLKDLKQYHWIDDGTRVVLLEMSIYSTNENIFAYGLLMIEFWPTGAILTYPTISTIIVDNADSPFRNGVRIAGRITIYLYVLGYIRGEYNELKQSGCRAYCCSCWNIIDMTNYFLFVISFIYWVLLLIQKQSLSSMLNYGLHKRYGNIPLTKRNDYIDVYGVGT